MHTAFLGDSILQAALTPSLGRRLTVALGGSRNGTICQIAPPNTDDKWLVPGNRKGATL